MIGSGTGTYEPALMLVLNTCSHLRLRMQPGHCPCGSGNGRFRNLPFELVGEIERHDAITFLSPEAYLYDLLYSHVFKI
jgi:hypothetical protein